MPRTSDLSYTTLKRPYAISRANRSTCRIFSTTDASEANPSAAARALSSSSAALMTAINFSTFSAAYPLPSSSSLTPSSPILSSLSKIMQTGMTSSSPNPADLIMSVSSRRSLMRRVKSVNPMLSSAEVVAAISSISALLDESPIMSISHWKNSRSRPFCGRSARNTRSI